MPPVQLLIKPSSGMCNLRCRYCFYHDITSKRDQENYGFMTRDTMEQIIKKALNHADHSCGFAFQGGEPTLIGLDFYREVIKLQERYNSKQLQIHNSIQTNGYKLDKEWAEFFARNHFLVGLSLDGVKQSHDVYRVDAKNQGTFADIMETAALFDQYHVEYNILTVVHAKTAAKIRKIYEFYKKNQFHYLQFIACLDPIGEKPGLSEYSLTPEAYGQFLIDLFDLWYIDLQHGNQPYIRTFENYIAILMGYPPESCEQRGTCSMQHVIEADGSVYPCDFYVLDEYCVGNIHEHDFAELEACGLSSGFIEKSMNQSEDCKHCAYFPVCRGGCNRHRSIEEGMGDGSSCGNKNYFCKSYQMFFEAALPRMQQIARMLRQQP